MDHRGTKLLLTICSIALALACSKPPADPADVVVARIDDRPLTLAELQTYFKANLLVDDESGELSRDEMNRVKSRLFDSFVDDRVLIADAERREGETTENDLEAQADAPPTDAEIRAYIEQHRDQLEPRKEVELSSLMLATMEEAAKVYRQVRRRRMTFNEAVVQYATNPGERTPLHVPWDSLTDELRKALEGLKPGQVTRPIDIHGEAYLFRLDSPPREIDTAEDDALSAWASRELQAQRHRQAYERMLEEARAACDLRLYTDNLPFEYVPDAS